MNDLEHNTRRINRRTAFVVMNNLDRENRATPGIVAMMRAMVSEFGVDGAMARCTFPPHIPQEAIELQRLCCEYLAFEEGAADEASVIATQKDVEARHGKR